MTKRRVPVFCSLAQVFGPFSALGQNAEARRGVHSARWTALNGESYPKRRVPVFCSPVQGGRCAFRSAFPWTMAHKWLKLSRLFRSVSPLGRRESQLVTERHREDLTREVQQPKMAAFRSAFPWTMAHKLQICLLTLHSG